MLICLLTSLTQSSVSHLKKYCYCTFEPWRWQQYDPSKCPKLLAQLRKVVFKKNKILLHEFSIDALGMKVQNFECSGSWYV